MAAPSTRSRTRGDKAKEAEANEAAEGNEGEDETTETPSEGDDDAAKAAEAKAAEDAKENERERKAREKAEAEEKARQAKIEAGDMIVTDTHEFEAGVKETKVSGQVEDIIREYQENGVEQPLVFASVVEKIDAKYPEDLIPAMHALETLGLVRRFDARNTKDDSQRRRSTAYQWVSEDQDLILGDGDE